VKDEEEKKEHEGGKVGPGRQRTGEVEAAKNDGPGFCGTDMGGGRPHVRL